MILMNIVDSSICGILVISFVMTLTVDKFDDSSSLVMILHPSTTLVFQTTGVTLYTNSHIFKKGFPIHWKKSEGCFMHVKCLKT